MKPGEVARRQAAPCFEAPPSLYDGRIFALLRKGVAPLREAPRGFAGNPQAAATPTRRD